MFAGQSEIRKNLNHNEFLEWDGKNMIVSNTDLGYNIEYPYQILISDINRLSLKLIIIILDNIFIIYYLSML